MNSICLNLKEIFKRVFYISVIYFFLAQFNLAQAAELCIDATRRSNATSAYSIDPLFSAREAQLIRGVIGRLRKYSAEVIVPLPDIVKRSVNFKNSAYSAVENKIFLGINSLNNFNLRKAIVVLSHEFGHALFDLNIIYDFEGKKVNALQGAKIVQDLRKSIESSSEYKKAIAEMNERFRRYSPEKREEEADLIFKQLGGEEYYRIFKVGNYLSDIMLAHNELFADMIAVMLTRDGNSVADAFRNENTDGSSEMTRSFLRKHKLDDFYIEHVGNYPYELLNPTRSYIWYRYLSTLSPEYYPKFVKAYMNAAQAHLNALFATGRTPRELAIDQYPREMNPVFIKFLEEEATKLGIPQAKE